MKLNTPTAIFLGLALIAVAIFFQPEIISEAQASRDCATSSELDDAVSTLKTYIVVWGN